MILMKRRQKNPFLRTRQRFSDTPSSVPLPSEAEVPAEAGSPLSPARTSPSDLHYFEARTSEVARSSTSNI